MKIGKKYLLIFLLIFPSTYGFSQNRKENDEVRAEFPGGFEKLKVYINKNIVVPKVCYENEYLGKYYV